MKIEVTQDLIDKGVKGDCSACPVALAFLLHPEVGRVAIGPGTLDIDLNVPPFVWSTEELPSKVDDWMADFDMGGQVEPFSFEIEVPGVS